MVHGAWLGIFDAFRIVTGPGFRTSAASIVTDKARAALASLRPFLLVGPRHFSLHRLRKATDFKPRAFHQRDYDIVSDPVNDYIVFQGLDLLCCLDLTSARALLQTLADFGPLLFCGQWLKTFLL